MIGESIITYLIFLIVFDVVICNWFQMMTKRRFYFGSAARLEWSSFFALGKALAKKAGTEGGIAAQITIIF